jgi:hypothetical protein
MRDHPIVPRQEIEPRSLRRQSFIRMWEYQWPVVARSTSSRLTPATNIVLVISPFPVFAPRDHRRELPAFLASPGPGEAGVQSCVRQRATRVTTVASVALSREARHIVMVDSLDKALALRTGSGKFC